ncbi:MAG: hypothetical protein [Microviridae sp.]|nr:MAG: hypothetical protein [Microviridae sp.]
MDKQKDTLDTQLNVSKTHNETSSKTTVNEQIEDTPFRIINIEEKGWFLAIGNVRITEPTEDKESLIQRVKSIDWSVIMPVITTFVEYVIDIKEKIKQ